MHVTELVVYPLKGARGAAVEEALVEPSGFAGDRRWMVIDAEGRFVSQRSHPQLARVDAALTADGLRVTAPGRPPLHARRPGRDAATCQATVWGDEVAARVARPEATAWFSDLLGQPVRLAYQPDEALRLIDERYRQGTERVSLADGYPVLLTHDASLTDLNSRLAEPVPMNRFRANLVVTGGEAFAEERWARVQVGEVVFRVVKPCGRCSVITVDQQNGVAGREPLRTLAAYRTQGGKARFGMNLVPETPGTVRRGDELKVVEHREEGARY